MQSTPLRRGLAILLCVQPVFWMSNVALAQSLQQPGVFSAPSSAAPALPVPVAPSEPEAVRAERPVLTQAVPGAPPVDEPIDPDRYACGSGDVLELNFWGMQNFKLRVTIDMEGRAFVSRVGYFRLQGKTLSEARRMMRESVARYFPVLSFDVTLAEPRTFLVQVVDDVAHPGPYPARAIDRVATLIGRAGGFGPNASKRRVEIRRRDGSTIQADLLMYTLTGDVRHNPYLLDGDIVRVPFEELAASIGGAVNRPGRYELIGTRDLGELVGLAGGLAPMATRALPIIVVRRGQDERLKEDLHAFTAEGGLPPVPIQHEDGVSIPGFGELQRSVTLVGAFAGVSAPDDASAVRRLPFAQGESVRTLLERVGGVGSPADLNGSYLIRNGESLPIDLYSLVVLRDLKADHPVELGDTLVVPFKRRNIAVEGAVFRPGSYQYNPSYGIEQYLSLAGGLNRFAEGTSDVYVVTPNGEKKPYAPDLKVEPGSSLVAPERNFSRAEVVGIIIAAASVLLSGVAVVLAARK